MLDLSIVDLFHNMQRNLFIVVYDGRYLQKCSVQISWTESSQVFNTTISLAWTGYQEL